MGLGEDCPAGSIPAARVEGLVVTVAGDETLVYDSARHHLHRLPSVTAAIWRRCDGRRTVTDVREGVASELGLPVEVPQVCRALAQLEERTLLAGPLPVGVRERMLSRRRFAARLGIAGAVALPAIVSITVPAAAFSTTCEMKCATHDACRVPPRDCTACRQKICKPDMCTGPCYDDGACIRGGGPCTVCVGAQAEIVPGTCQRPPSVTRAAGIETSAQPQLEVKVADVPVDVDDDSGAVGEPDVVPDEPDAPLPGGTPVVPGT